MNFNSLGSKLVSNDSKEMHLVGPDGFSPLFVVKDDKEGWRVTVDDQAEGAEPCLLYVVGQDSAAYRRRRNGMADALRARGKVLKSAEIEQEAMKMVAAAVVGWKNIAWGEEGEKAGLLDFTDDNLLKFLELYRPAFDQVNEFIGDRSNFLRVG